MLERLRRTITIRRVATMRWAAAALYGWSQACIRFADGSSPAENAAPKPVKPRAVWSDVLARFATRDAASRLFGAGVIGDELPRDQGPPSGRRILVLAAHQDDEIIGAGGTFLLCAQRGCAFEVIYSTDGATRLADVPAEDVARWRRDEATKVWRRLAGCEPVFWDYPSRVSDVAPDAGARLVAAVDRFRPDTIFVPLFLEQPLEHRRLNDVLLAAHAIRPFGSDCEIWGYQITTRIAGNRAVNITPVWKDKYALNQLWATQNAYMDYAHLAMGRDIANSYYLKGAKHPRHAAAHAELFLAFDAPAYLELAARFTDLVPTRSQAGPPPPDFLIVGMQKSGSYWLTALLDAHPAIRCFPSRPGKADGAGEAHLFDIIARLDADFTGFRRSMRGKLDGWFADVVPDAPPATPSAREELIERLRTRFNEYCDAQRQRAGKTRVGEKTTETVHHPELVEKLYPGIRKICILRDPRDRVVSFFFHQQRKGRLREGDRLSEEHVRDYVTRVQDDYRGLLRMRAPVHVLTYERLSAAPHDEVRRMLESLDVDAGGDTVEAMVRAASFEALSGRRPGDVDAASHFRQGAAGGWRMHLAPVLADRMVKALEDLTAQVEVRFGVDLSAYREAGELAEQEIKHEETLPR